MSDIVIHEDDDLMRALLQEWLRGAGYHVHADTAHEGSADLVIVSIFLPKHAGARRVRELRAANPGTPVIAISGHFHSSLSAGGSFAQALGVQQVIAKPLTRRALLGAVQSVIGPPS